MISNCILSTGTASYFVISFHFHMCCTIGTQQTVKINCTRHLRVKRTLARHYVLLIDVKYAVQHEQNAKWEIIHQLTQANRHSSNPRLSIWGNLTLQMIDLPYTFFSLVLLQNMLSFFSFCWNTHLLERSAEQ